MSEDVTSPGTPSAAAVRTHAWGKALLAHLAATAGGSLPFLDDAAGALDRALARGDERGLELVARELREWATGISSRRFAAIDEDLTARFGAGLVDAERSARQVVRRILRRGSIDDAAEYRALRAWLDGARADPAQRQAAEAVEALLVEYELRTWTGH